MTEIDTDKLRALIEQLRKVEGTDPDIVGVATVWNRNPDGPEAADTILAMVEDNKRMREALTDIMSKRAALDGGYDEWAIGYEYAFDECSEIASHALEGDKA